MNVAFAGSNPVGHPVCCPVVYRRAQDALNVLDWVQLLAGLIMNGLPIVEYFIQLHIVRGEPGVVSREIVSTPRYATPTGKPFTEEDLRAEMPRLMDDLLKECFKVS